MKMTNETKKIMEDDSIAVSSSFMTYPVLSAHSESVYIETKKWHQLTKWKLLLQNSLVRTKRVANQVYPQQAVNAVEFVCMNWTYP